MFAYGIVRLNNGEFGGRIEDLGKIKGEFKGFS